MGKIREMPLFPLGTVLFPGMVLPLHIFEPRYKQMIGECIRDNEPFGVVLIKEGNEVGKAASPYTIGTSAYVTHCHKFEDGRMNIQTVGYQRFKVHDLHNNKPYIVGLVEDMPLGEADPDTLNELVSQFRPKFQTYLDSLIDAANVQVEVEEMPDDPLALAIFAAITMPIPSEEKQGLLATDNLEDMLKAELKLLSRETLLLGQMLEERQSNDDNPFSLN